MRDNSFQQTQRGFHQAPNQMPVPCTIPTGGMIAPAIKKPQLPALKHDTMCVSQEEIDHKKPIKMM